MSQPEIAATPTTSSIHSECHEIELKFRHVSFEIIKKRLKQLGAKEAFVGDITDIKYRPRVFEYARTVLPRRLSIDRTDTGIRLWLDYTRIIRSADPTVTDITRLDESIHLMIPVEPSTSDDIWYHTTHIFERVLGNHPTVSNDSQWLCQWDGQDADDIDTAPAWVDGHILRIRTMCDDGAGDEHVYLTGKIKDKKSKKPKPQGNPPSPEDTVLDEKMEYEVSIAPETMDPLRKLLSMMGFTVKSTVRKHRRMFLLPLAGKKCPPAAYGGEVVLDQVRNTHGITRFRYVEVAGNTRGKVLATIKAINLNPSDGMSSSLSEIKTADRQENLKERQEEKKQYQQKKQERKGKRKK